MSRPRIPSWVVDDEEIFSELEDLFKNKLSTDKITIFDVRFQKLVTLKQIILETTKGIVPNPAYLPVLRLFLEGLQERFDLIKHGTTEEFKRWVKHFEHVYSHIDELNQYVDGVEGKVSVLKEDNSRLKELVFSLKNEISSLNIKLQNVQDPPVRVTDQGKVEVIDVRKTSSKDDSSSKEDDEANYV